MKKIIIFILAALLIYFIILSFYLRTRPIEQKQDSKEIVSLYRPHLENINSILKQKALFDSWNRYYDPAYFLEYFKQYNSILQKLKKINPNIFSVLPKRSFPLPSKTTDFDGRGYLVKTDLEKLSEDINLAIALIDNNYGIKISNQDEKKKLFYEQWWFQFLIAPFIVGIILIIIERIIRKK
ncbi:MAG: hypothetical protein LHV68_13055 [Elusimicrobia bacterium]|nr:hypothetical protein [Candidatus Liberimonas magnetica]